MQIVVRFIKTPIPKMITLQETLDFDTRCGFIFIYPRISFDRGFAEILIASMATIFFCGRSFLVTQYIKFIPFKRLSCKDTPRTGRLPRILGPQLAVFLQKYPFTRPEQLRSTS
jgi:hypothetical protein